MDDNPDPYATFLPPKRFELDATRLEDGKHLLRIVAIDSSGHRGVRTVPFEVRNGPGIAVDGLHDHEVVEGKITVLVNAYGGAYEEIWEPARAGTRAPVPTWVWVVFIVIIAWALYYGIELWRPPAQFAETPTYGSRAFPPPAAKPAAAVGADLLPHQLRQLPPGKRPGSAASLSAPGRRPGDRPGPDRPYPHRPVRDEGEHYQRRDLLGADACLGRPTLR